jgi:alanyl-tRNA synthetase
LILSEKGYDLDEDGFNAAMQKQKDRSKSASEISKQDWTILIDDKVQEFIGYDTLQSKIRLVKYRKITSKKDGVQYQLVFDLTPFYPEGGGQVGDKGYLESVDGDVVYIIDTKKENNEIVHFVKNLPKKLDGTFEAIVDAKHRQLTEANHTATHLLHQALREVLGRHVEQKGSAVHSRYLRFDFSHFSKMTDDELKQVEDFVNARIAGQLPLEEKRNIPMHEALESGAMALFGEKYGDTVRTIKFGQSVELCGGTHVKNTGDIWHFKLKSEGAVAAGIRRIEAITSDAVKEYFFDNNQSLEAIKQVLGNGQDPIKAVSALQQENTELKKQVAQLLKEKAKNLKGDLAKELEDINGVQFLAKKIDLDAAGIKDLSFEMGQNRDNLFIFFATEQSGKALLSCYISKELVASRNLNAGTIVRELGKHIQGGGGGQPFFATAGGKNPDGIQEALEKARDYISKQ